MIAAPVVALLLGATPSILVVPATPGARPVCESLLEGLSNEKVRVKLAGEQSAAVECVAKHPAGTPRVVCLVEAVTDAKADALLVVTASGKPRLTVGLQLFSRTGESERKETVRAPRARLATAAKPAIVRTIQTLRSVLLIEETRAIQAREVDVPPPPKREPPPVEPRPPVAELNLAPREAPATIKILPEVRQRPLAGAWAMTALALVGAGAGGTFGALGYFGKNRLGVTSVGISELSWNQAVALRDQTNLQFTIALAAGITAGVAALIAGILWAQ